VVCGNPGRYARDPKTAGAVLWCADHVPAALPPWVLLARALLILAVLGPALYHLGRWLLR